MGEFRIMEKLLAQILTDYTYTHDVAHSKILIRSGDTFKDYVRKTIETELTLTETNYNATTVDFILPRNYKYVTLLDGVARGNLRLRGYTISDASATINVIFYAVVSLITKTTGGAVTTLASTTTGTITHTSGPGTVTNNQQYDIPFWIDLDGASDKIPAGEKLFLRVVFYGKWTQSGGAGATTHQLFYQTAFNSDDIFVEIPIVP